MATENSSVRAANYVIHQWEDERDKLFALFYAIQSELKSQQKDGFGFEIPINLAQIGIDTTASTNEIQSIQKMFNLEVTV